MEPQHQADFEADSDGVSPDIGALYEEHKDAMYGMARSMLRNDDQRHVEDVVQDVVVAPAGATHQHPQLGGVPGSRGQDEDLRPVEVGGAQEREAPAG